MKIKLSAILFSLLLMASPVMAADTMLIVVRHAEKSTDDPKDPSLSEQGNARARKLAEVLKNCGVINPSNILEYAA
ncbi:MAG TPA: hypothetical protein PK135_14130, partial [Arenimonas sp.]|nr:hypothetical protein [Arenimonas sp.]